MEGAAPSALEREARRSVPLHGDATILSCTPGIRLDEFELEVTDPNANYPTIVLPFAGHTAGNT